MNLNATLFAQVVVFLILAWFTMKFIWPPLMAVLDERAKKIAEGLAAADRGHADLIQAKQAAQTTLAQANEAGQKRIQDAEKHAQSVLDAAKIAAEKEASRIIENAKLEASQHLATMREALRREVAVLSIKGAEQILKREVNPAAHADFLKKLQSELAS